MSPPLLLLLLFSLIINKKIKNADFKIPCIFPAHPRRCESRMGSVSEARVDAAPSVCLGYSAAICTGGDLHLGDLLSLLGYL